MEPITALGQDEGSVAISTGSELANHRQDAVSNRDPARLPRLRDLERDSLRLRELHHQDRKRNLDEVAHSDGSQLRPSLTTH